MTDDMDIHDRVRYWGMMNFALVAAVGATADDTLFSLVWVALGLFGVSGAFAVLNEGWNRRLWKRLGADDL